MEIVRDDGFGRLFNSPLEAGIRAVVVLEHLRPIALDLTDLVLLDYLIVHTEDIGGPESLHPALPDRKGELLVRRRLVETSVELMRKSHLIEQEIRADGVFYRASEEAAGYVELLEAEYSLKLKARGAWLGEEIRTKSFVRFKDDVRSLIGPWAEVFTQDNSPEA